MDNIAKDVRAMWQNAHLQHQPRPQSAAQKLGHVFLGNGEVNLALVARAVAGALTLGILPAIAIFVDMYADDADKYYPNTSALNEMGIQYSDGMRNFFHMPSEELNKQKDRLDAMSAGIEGSAKLSPEDVKARKGIVDFLNEDEGALTLLFDNPSLQVNVTDKQGNSTGYFFCRDQCQNLDGTIKHDRLQLGYQSPRDNFLPSPLENLLDVSAYLEHQVKCHPTCLQKLTNMNFFTGHKQWKLEGVDLSGKDLKGAFPKIPEFFQPYVIDLKNANLQNTTLTEMNLRGADLKKAKLINATILDTQLSGADMTETDWTSATLKNVQMPSATLLGAKFNSAKLYNVNFTASKEDVDKLSKVSFQDAELERVHFIKAKLTEVSFENAKLTKVSFYKAELTNVSFKGTTLTETDFTQAKLHKVNLLGAKIDKDTTFTDAEISLALPQWNDNLLDQYLNHLNKPKDGSLLTVIDSINDAYSDLKINLMHQIIDSLEKVDISNVREALLDILRKPIYLADGKIQSFIKDKRSQ